MDIKFGYKQSPPDSRDWIWRVSDRITLPKRVALWDRWPRIEDQGDLGSCVAQGATTLAEFNDQEPDNEYVELSRRMLYQLCRIEDGSFPKDEGTSPKTAVKILTKYGTCLESLCNYNRQCHSPASGYGHNADDKRNFSIFPLTA